MASPRDYKVGADAALKLMQDTLAHLKIPGFIRGMIPVDKEPEAAAAIGKVVIDAVDADRAAQQKLRDNQTLP